MKHVDSKLITGVMHVPSQDHNYLYEVYMYLCETCIINIQNTFNLHSPYLEKNTKGRIWVLHIHFFISVSRDLYQMTTMTFTW